MRMDRAERPSIERLSFQKATSFLNAMKSNTLCSRDTT
jgi:hypothetical protein